MKSGRTTQFLISLAVSITSLAVGVSLAWPTPVIPKFHNNETGFIITEKEISWVAAMASLGYMASSFVCQYIMDRSGRKGTILGSALPFIIGALIVLNTTRAWIICVARFLWGGGNGLVLTVTGIYIAEIADREIRGTLIAVNRLVLHFATFCLLTVGPFISYTAINYVLLILAICYLVICFFIPESPYFLLKVGKINAARKAIKNLTKSKNEKVIEDKLSAMRSDVRKETRRSGSMKEMFTGKQYRKAIIISLGIKMTQLMIGTLPIQQYAGQIFQESKADISLSTALIVLGVVRFVAGILTVVVADKIGRRPLLIYSFLLSGITLLVIGIYFFIKPTSSSFYNYIPFIGILITSVLSTVGYDTIPFIVTAEIFPINIKSVGLAFTQVYTGFITFLSVKGYQEVKDIAGLAGVFWVYAIFGFIGAIFTYSVVPETKGKSLREIQIELQGDLYDEVNEKLDGKKVVEDENEAVAELSVLEKK